MRYHRLHPEYIHKRIELLGHSYNLRILLLLCDIVRRLIISPSLWFTQELHRLSTKNISVSSLRCVLSPLRLLAISFDLRIALQICIINNITIIVAWRYVLPLPRLIERSSYPRDVFIVELMSDTRQTQRRRSRTIPLHVQAVRA